MALPTADVISDQIVATGTVTTVVDFSGIGTAFSWVNDTPGIGLAASGTGNIPAFTAINNTNNPVIASIMVTPANAAGCSGVPVTFTITVDPPVVLTAMGPLSPLTTVYGTSSAAESFTVSGTGITSAILITPPGGFEVSTDGTAYAMLATIRGTGKISSVSVYVRLASGTSAGSYSGNIALSSDPAANIDVLVPYSTVTPAPLTITADNKTRLYGTPNPEFTLTYSGFVNNDGPGRLTGQPDVSTVATTFSPIGQYSISVNDAASPNYMFTYVTGVLTIQPMLSSLSIPNTFTPNGDEINDTWEIKGLLYDRQSTVYIFNRWGQKLYSSTGYAMPWDGKYNGRVLPSATYYYIIDPKNGQPVISGSVTIIR